MSRFTFNPFLSLHTEKTSGAYSASSTNDERKHESCRVVEIMVCNHRTFGDAGNGKLAFAFYDLSEDRAKANYLNKKEQVSYNDCGCEEQNSLSTGKKICKDIDDPKDPGDSIY